MNRSGGGWFGFELLFFGRAGEGVGGGFAVGDGGGDFVEVGSADEALVADGAVALVGEGELALLELGVGEHTVVLVGLG